MYKIFKELNLVNISEKYQEKIKNNNKEDITCYDGPPSVSGLPGIHHVLSRTLKDIFCRYNYLRGKNIVNKAGWDTHGLPIELKVEKDLKITKKDIGVNISISEYNEKCKESIYKYINKWEDLSKKHNYCTDINNPYITCDMKYIESEWWAFKQLYDKKYIYQDYSIQPYSPAAGTGLSSHELNQPGCYKIVKDLTVTAMFKSLEDKNTYFIAWTTTPWTLPANSALAVNKNVIYVKISCFNRYSNKKINVIMAEDALSRYFNNYSEYIVLKKYKGSELIGKKYKQLFDFVKPKSKGYFFNLFKKKPKAFEIISADYVTTTDGTGIVHIAPSFGADDNRVAKEAGISNINVYRNGMAVPIVDEQGKYVEEITPWAGCYVKIDYYDNKEEAVNVDVEIVKKLKTLGLCFKSEKYEHSYPHCWRTDKPLLYYPLKAWFIKTTAIKEKMIELNKNINWQPKSTGEGRFKNWLENIVDWNVSRNRFWGTPIPIWMTKDGKEIKVIGSIKELNEEYEKATNYFKSKKIKIPLSNEDKEMLKDFNTNHSNYNEDLHIPNIDKYIMVSDSGKMMFRVPEILDVWFDSGCMPFAQYHYPFENKDFFEKHFPADFICEGVDQTRGWFFTLHVLSTMLFDKIAYKNVISNGLVLDKNGDKMSKRLGNTIDPFELFDKYGSDAVRWYMILNNDPWENLKFNISEVEEVIRKFFMTFFNTYNFFAMYANINKIIIKDYEITIDILKNNILDEWIISKLNTVIKNSFEYLDNYDPTKAIRLINNFVIDDLSNWYVRLNRKRFSKNDNEIDKKNAFIILYECLYKISVIIYPFVPSFSEYMKNNLKNC